MTAGSSGTGVGVGGPSGSMKWSFTVLLLNELKDSLLEDEEDEEEDDDDEEDEEDEDEEEEDEDEDEDLFFMQLT